MIKLVISAVVVLIAAYFRFYVTAPAYRLTNDPKVIITNQNSETYTFKIRSADSNGSKFEFETLIKHDGLCGSKVSPFQRPCTPPIHIHRFQNETFEVLKGKMTYYLNGETGTLSAGDKPIKITPFNKHTFWNEGNEDLLVRITLEPALFSENFFENLAGAGRDGLMSFIQATLFTCSEPVIFTENPLSAHPLLREIICFVGKHLLGYRSFYPEYTTTHRDILLTDYFY
ncbi:hypothetical protein ABK040_005312 [Willaertia magna]